MRYLGDFDNFPPDWIRGRRCVDSRIGFTCSGRDGGWTGYSRCACCSPRCVPETARKDRISYLCYIALVQKSILKWLRRSVGDFYKQCEGSR